MRKPIRQPMEGDGGLGRGPGPRARNDGGPAFARPISTDEARDMCNVAWAQDGMSLRDYFAAKALPAVIAATSAGQHVPEGDGALVERMVRDAYAIADAMLAEREK